MKYFKYHYNLLYWNKNVDPIICLYYLIWSSVCVLRRFIKLFQAKLEETSVAN